MADLSITESLRIAKALNDVAAAQFRLVELSDDTLDPKPSEETFREAAEEFVRAEFELQRQIDDAQIMLGMKPVAR